MPVEKQCVLVEASPDLEPDAPSPAPLGAGVSGAGTGAGEVSRPLVLAGRRLYATTAQRGAILKQRWGSRLYANPRIRHPEGARIAREAPASVQDVRNKLHLTALAQRDLCGRNVVVAILDDGVHRESLESRLRVHGLRLPTLDASKRLETIPSPFSRGRRTHGTMCAFDVTLAAPECTLLDFPVNAPQAVIEPRIADVIAACEYLRILLERREIESLVVLAAWQTLEKDEIDGIPSDSPDHPLYRVLSALESAGADIVFSAPDHHAQFIHGPALHPGVLTVSAIDLDDNLFPTAARGPAASVVKPDIVNYEGFLGYEMFKGTPDYGTSAAAALTAGIVAALRSHSRVRGLSACALREALRATARDLGQQGVDPQTGWGVIDVSKLLTWADRLANEPPAPRAGQPGAGSGRARRDCAAGAEKKRLLLFLLADLLSDDDVRDEFLQDPEGVMVRYELVGEQRCALLSLDPGWIGGVVADEARETIENEVLSPNWPVPEPNIAAVEPGSARRAVLGELSVTGENLMRGAEIILRPMGFVGPELKFVAREAKGPIRETTLSVVGADFTLAPPGTYQVAVRNCAEAALIESNVTFTVLET